MSTSPVSRDLIKNNFVQPLQESGSLARKVITKVYKTTSYVIYSISSIAQSILSECIYVGSFGRYTIEDLKSYLFTKKVSLEEKIVPDSSSAKTDVREEKSAIQRHPSKVSVASSYFRRVIEISENEDSPYSGCYRQLKGLVKLSSNATAQEIF